jgi:hypothetical protein
VWSVECSSSSVRDCCHVREDLPISCLPLIAFVFVH